jgi:ATP-dependent Clp endopeptidase proteolytic subunit ClpP
MTDAWYSIATNGASDPEILIYDRIGSGFFDEGVTAQAFQRDLAALNDYPRLTLRINSPGGSVWDGMAIYNAVKDHPAHVTTIIDGLAASIASVIALAGDEVRMADGALMMIHDPSVMAEGGADDMRSAANMLDRITTFLVDVYTARTGWTPDETRAAMAAETWYTAREAHAAGLVDTITNQFAAAAVFDLTAYPYLHTPSNERLAPVDTTTIPPVDASTDTPPSVTPDALAAFERRIAAMIDTAPAPRVHPLAAFASLADYAVAAYKGDAPPLNLIADQITTDNPGVMPPNWATEIHGIFGHGRPAVSALGVQSAGDSGLDFAWPYFDGDLSAIVAAQTTEKTEVNSIKISIKKGTASLKTYGAVSDVAYQLLMRSQPSYLDALLRIYALAAAVTTDNVFADALVSGGTASTFDYDFAADTDGKAFRSAMFHASVEVESATGMPATVALVATDVFLKAGTWDTLVPSKYGTQNVGGTAQASTLEVDVSGLPVVHDRNMAAGSIVVTNPSAAKWIEDGPHYADAQVPSKLGADYAIFTFGVPALYLPKGVVKVTNVTP